MKMSNFLCLLALVVGMTSTAFAGGPVTLTLGAVGVALDGDRDIDNDVMPALGLEYRFNEKWAMEVLGISGEVNSDLPGGDLDYTQWHLDGLYYLERAGNWEPYLAFGAGETEFDRSGYDNVETAINAGFGARYHFDNNWSARTDFRMLSTFDNEFVDAALLVGLSYAFGGDKPAPTAPKPVVKEIGDSDKDGVLDDRDACPNSPAGTEVDKTGCKVKEKRRAEINLKVNFANNSAEVTEEFMGEIDDLAQYMNRFPSEKLVIEAHTSDVGSADYNMALSQRRAAAVVEILVERFGINASRLSSKGYGESRPIASNDTKEGQAANRRLVASASIVYEVEVQK